MNEKQNAQKSFLTITMISVIVLTAVFVTYAALLATYTGTTVTVNQTGGSMQYNLANDDNSTWTDSLAAINNGTAWYARINITNAAQQDVVINWVLQKYTAPNWIDQSIPVNTTMTLASGLNTIYATETGVFTDNFNWGTLTTSGGSYRVQARVNG